LAVEVNTFGSSVVIDENRQSSEEELK